MTDLKIEAGTLTASLDDRAVTGLLVPFGEVGRTNLGRFQVDSGAFALPADPDVITLNDSHRRESPLGRATAVHEDENGITATFRVANTPEGDELLLELADPENTSARRNLSAEVRNVVIRDGKAVGGVLFGAAVVTRGAFPSAALMAEDTPDPIEKETQMTTPAAPAASTTTAVATPTLTNVLEAFGRRDHKAIEAAVGEENASTLFAAVGDVTHAGHTATVSDTGWLGELWHGKAYERRIVPLVSSGVLTSWKVKGWKMTAGPTVAPYAGNLTAIPSTNVTTVPYETEASRLAGGWAVDRKFQDFNDTEFLAGLFRAATEDYARKTDAALLASLVTNSSAVTAGAVPANVNAGMAKVIDGALSMIDFASPSYALVAPDVYRTILLSRDDDSLEYLSSALGLESGTVSGFKLVPVSGLAAGKVIVGAKEAVSFYELPGVPIRAEAQNIARGGFDNALFGYFAVVVNDARGLVSVNAA